MKPFNLDEYLANPNRKIVTKDGRSVKIICTDSKFTYANNQYPIVALVESKSKLNEIVCTFLENGRFIKNEISKNDLFFSSEKHEGWINIYKENEGLKGEYIYPSEKEASNEGKYLYNYIATSKIEWEE